MHVPWGKLPNIAPWQRPACAMAIAYSHSRSSLEGGNIAQPTVANSGVTFTSASHPRMSTNFGHEYISSDEVVSTYYRDQSRPSWITTTSRLLVVVDYRYLSCSIYDTRMKIPNCLQSNRSDSSPNDSRPRPVSQNARMIRQGRQASLPHLSSLWARRPSSTSRRISNPEIIRLLLGRLCATACAKRSALAHGLTCTASIATSSSAIVLQCPIEGSCHRLDTHSPVSQESELETT